MGDGRAVAWGRVGDATRSRSVASERPIRSIDAWVTARSSRSRIRQFGPKTDATVAATFRAVLAAVLQGPHARTRRLTLLAALDRE